MKKIYLILVMVVALLVASCGTAKYTSQAVVTDQAKIEQVINDYYPALKEYQDEGVIQIASVKEQTLADGETQYDVRYKFIENYYEGEDLINLLKEKYPDVYRMYMVGMVKDVQAYKFVDDKGNVVNNVSYNHVRRHRGFLRPWFHRGNR